MEWCYKREAKLEIKYQGSKYREEERKEERRRKKKIEKNIAQVAFNQKRKASVLATRGLRRLVRNFL